MRHAFHPDALLEFEEAVQFYKGRGRALGQRFAQEIQTTIAKIVATPDRCRVIEQDVRRCLVRVFPYAVLYAIEVDCILIIAIAHGKPPRLLAAPACDTLAPHKAVSPNTSTKTATQAKR